MSVTVRGTTRPSTGVVSISLALAAGLVLGCSPSRSAESVSERPVTPPRPEAEARPALLPLFDENGDLIESDQEVAGLRLPRGLISTLESGNRHVYRSEVAVEPMRRYFGVRLLTGDVSQPRPNAVMYRGGTPRSVSGTPVPLDVGIEESSRGTRVEIIERPGGVREMTEAEAIGRLRERLERAD